MLKKLTVILASLAIVFTNSRPVFAAASPATNLIPNPSVETATGTTPQDWQGSSWGNNASVFTYLTTGHTGTHSLKAEISSYTDGAANWYYTGLPLTPGITYQYQNWYQSNVDTEVDAEVVLSDNSTTFSNLGRVLASTAWAPFTTTFTTPAGAKSVAIYQILTKVGYVISDDYSLSVYNPTPFNRPILSISFDDGWANQYQNAYPVMQSFGQTGTYNIISGSLTDQPSYMDITQVKSLLASGDEIASHSVTHPDLTTLTQAQITAEMANSQATLQAALGVPVTDFAYPFGSYDAATIATGKTYYQSQRTVNAGYNTKDSLDPTQLKIFEVDSNITQAQVQTWVDEAIANKSWLILVYHEVATTPTDPTDALYTTSPADFSAEMAYIHSTAIATETVAQALQEVSAQLSQPADTTPPVVSGITASGVTNSSATVTWATDKASTSQVNYGLTPAYGSSSQLDPTLVTAHSVRLTNLTAGTIYHYQIVTKDAAGNTTSSPDHSFTTSAVAKVGDANGDGRVNAIDLSILASHWNTLAGATTAQGDLNGDGKVNAVDLSILSSNWGK